MPIPASQMTGKTQRKAYPKPQVPPLDINILTIKKRQNKEMPAFNIEIFFRIKKPAVIYCRFVLNS